MFSPVASTALLLAVLAVVQAVPVPVPGYQHASDNTTLEPYNTYHTRYIALDCQDKHNTQFFTDCCHPLLATETLANNRKPYCDPSNSAAPASGTPASVPAALASTPAPVDTDDSEEDCEDDDDSDNTTPAPAPSDNNNNNSGNTNSGTYNGDATFFYQDGNPGNCGQYSQDTDYLIALPTSMYGGGEDCGRTVSITNTNNGKQVSAVVKDSCPTCPGNSIDLSVATFNAIATPEEGEVPITWSFTS